jgi:SPP1 gp7 family putative phage head morphogenesis protein
VNTSDRLLDLTAIRQLLLLRLISGENIRINKEYDAIAADIEKQLRGPELTEYKGRRLNQAIEELKARVIVPEPAIGELAATEANYTVASMAQVGIEAVLPPEPVIDRIGKSSLIQGATLGQWWGKLNETTQFDLERTIKNGVLLGQTNREIAKSIVGNGTDKGPEALSKARRDAVAITRTAVQTLSNEARIATYEKNADIIKAIQWVSTLDGRTSDICIARSGKTWSFPEFEPQGHNIPWGGGPPAHWACRSTTIPITKTFAEIDGEGKAGPNTQPSTRSSMDGQVAADLSFDQFLRSKPDSFADEMLGKGRAQLWRDGKITLSQLLSAQGTPLTLAQLKAKYGGVTKVKVDNTPEPKPIPARDVNAPAINPELTAATTPVLKKREVIRQLDAQLASAATSAAYGTENRIVYRDVKPKDIGKAALAGFDDEAASMVLALKPELDDISARFGIPPIRGIKVGRRTIAAMGDGVLHLNPDSFNSYSYGVGGKKPQFFADELEARVAKDMDRRDVLLGEISQLATKLGQIRGTPEYDEVFIKWDEARREATELGQKVNIARQELLTLSRAGGDASKWKPGNDVAERPFNTVSYFADGFDRARNVLYHEMAHHIHQMYGKEVSRLAQKPPVERDLINIWAGVNRAQKDLQASKYGTTDQYEWFAENFALYMMGKRDLVDADAAKLIERLLNEQANR